MSKKKTYLEPYTMLVVDTSDYLRVSLIVVNFAGEILHMCNVLNIDEYYFARKSVISEINNIISEYGVDTILMEQNKLFTDKMDKYPDAHTLRNIIFNFSLQVSIEDMYFDKLVLLSIPEYEWKKAIFGRGTFLTMDLYKSHVLRRCDIPIKFFIDIEKNNYYKAICLSESILFGNLMHTKYQINKGVL